MAITTTSFRPTTDSFGELIVKTRPSRRIRAPKNWLIGMSFIAALGAGAAGLLAIDNAIFDSAQHDLAAADNMHLDYD